MHIDNEDPDLAQKILTALERGTTVVIKRYDMKNSKYQFSLDTAEKRGFNLDHRTFNIQGFLRSSLLIHCPSILTVQQMLQRGPTIGPIHKFGQTVGLFSITVETIRKSKVLLTYPASIAVFLKLYCKKLLHHVSIANVIRSCIDDSWVYGLHNLYDVFKHNHFYPTFDVLRNHSWERWSLGGYFTYARHSAEGFATHVQVRSGCTMWSIIRPSGYAAAKSRKELDLLHDLFLPNSTHYL